MLMAFGYYYAGISFYPGSDVSRQSPWLSENSCCCLRYPSSLGALGMPPEDLRVMLW